METIDEQRMRLYFKASEPALEPTIDPTTESPRSCRYPPPSVTVVLVFRDPVSDTWVMGRLLELGITGLIEKVKGNTYRLRLPGSTLSAQSALGLKRLRRHARILL